MLKNFFHYKTIALAHRGLPLNYPENTMPSFKAALDSGADVLETDIRFTKDQKFAVIHDSTIDRTTNGKGRVIDYTLKELKEFDAGYNFSPDNGKTFPFRGRDITIPCVEELLMEFPQARFNIDLKDNIPEQTAHFAEILKKHEAEERTLVASRHHGNLKMARKLLPHTATSLSLREIIKFLTAAGMGIHRHIRVGGDALQIPPYYKNQLIATEKNIIAAHEIGLKVHFWTINDREAVKELINKGADGIFTENGQIIKDLELSLMR